MMLGRGQYRPSEPYDDLLFVSMSKRARWLTLDQLRGVSSLPELLQQRHGMRCFRSGRSLFLRCPPLTWEFYVECGVCRWEYRGGWYCGSL